jgi:hypothetical protein
MVLCVFCTVSTLWGVGEGSGQCGLVSVLSVVKQVSLVLMEVVSLVKQVDSVLVM